MTIPLHPLTFEPVYKDYLWGGRRVAGVFGRSPVPDVCAESWELADRDEGMSRVSAGPARGETLRTLVRGAGARLTGTAAPPDGRFPLMLKILDVASRTSLQVHPRETRREDDAMVEAKTELWYALPGMERGRIFAGLAEGVTREGFERALREKRVEVCLKDFPVEPGDAFYIPAGRVHAIDAGCLFLEIQQNSNTTYRVYDWDRVDAAGRSRTLHLEQARRAIDWEDHGSARCVSRPLEARQGIERRLIQACPFFRIESWSLGAAAPLEIDPRSFVALFVLEGNLTVEGGGVEARLAPGCTCLLPAALGRARLIAGRLPGADHSRREAGSQSSESADLLAVTL